MIKASSHNMNVVYRSVAIPVSPDVSPVKMPADKKTVNLAPTISNLQNDILEDVNRSIDTDDGDSRDNEDLVIDMKEEEMHEDRSNEDKFDNDKCKYKDYIQVNCHNLIYIVYTMQWTVSYNFELFMHSSREDR